MFSKKSVSSQRIITVEPNAYGHQYAVEIIFERSGEKKPLNLSMNNNNHFKHLCRTIIKGLDAFKDLPFAYDGCTSVWTPKALKDAKIQLAIAQPDLNDYLKHYLDDFNGVLHISLTKGPTIMMADFSNTVNTTTLVEDRSWRNLMELVLTEDAITRDAFSMLGPGCLYETVEQPFHSGLVFREGNTKGVHIIKGKNGVAEMCLAMDCCKKVFYPAANANFADFLKKFSNGGRRSNEDAEKLCWGLRLQLESNENSSKVFRFKKFSDDKLFAIMQIKNGSENELYPVEDLRIIPDQSVSLDAMPKDLKDKALDLNCFKPHDRKRFINDQFQKLQLKNDITAAFGVKVEEQMIEGTFDDPIEMDIRVNDNARIKPDENGAFRLDCRNYFRRGNYKKFVLLATKQDRDRSIEGVRKIIKFATNKPDHQINAMLMFEEFDTTSKDLNLWINKLSKFKDVGILVITVDETPESHSFLKFAEAVTGVNTQHLKLSTASNVRFQTSQNIVHKLNIKMGGLNHIIKFSSNVPNLDLNNGKVFVIGLDVCHPTGEHYKGSTDEPSFVGVAANYLSHPQEFGDLFFAQNPRQELIDSRPLIYFTEKLLKHVKQFRQIQTIVLIRDGVSEGQYSKVLEFEIEALRNAAKKLKMEVKIVAFIVTKNGNVRHFHEPNNGRIESMPPRSFVNFGTRYNFEQFYMTAHRSWKGTAKTIMITKIYDDIGISMAEAQEFLLGLTYLHQIVSCPISLPTTVNQADAIAQRGQNLYRTLKMFCPNKIPRNADGGIDNKKLTEILSINTEELPKSRYNA